MGNDWHASCKALLDAGRRAVSWVNDPQNANTIGVEKRSVDKRLRRMITETTKLQASIDRPMCVGVFGPSQAGKSYLVSVLARAGEKPLAARFAGSAEPVDFLREINPGGERESTGIVTRFSLRALPAPEGFPVCLRLLNETDIIKILGNTYFLDGEPKKQVPVEREDLQAILRDAAQIAAGRSDAEDNHLTVEEIWDLQDYFERTFEGTRAIDALRSYWDEASQLAPKLTITERATLFSVLWGRIEPFSQLYIQLTTALFSLGFARDAHCPIESLLPRSESIIDVQTLLMGLGRDDQPLLKIRGAGGTVKSVPRPIVTALVAELHIEMTDEPWPFFENTDLLDFPGARSRQPVDLEEQCRKIENNGLANLFLRGKVAYLFERYVAEQELTSMLLCIKPSNQDVPTLPNMIGDWIAKTHGSTAKARQGKTTVLFLVLTMFDTHFVDKAGEERADPGDRFKSRLFSSIESFFAKSHDWPTEWTTGEAFSNVYWLRNPNYPAESIIEYGEGGREVAYRADRTDYIARLREGYMRVPSVARFFRNPGDAFDEALKLNDGGVSYLAANLAPVCRPDLKHEQIAARLGELREQLSASLSPYYVSSDVDARLAERLQVCNSILVHVQRLGSEQRFADLLAALQISQHGFSDVLYDVFTRRAREKDQDGDNGNRRPAPLPLLGVPSLPGLPPLPGMPAQPPLTATTNPDPARPGSTNLGLSQAAIGFWIDVMRSNAETETLARFFQGDIKIALELVGELANAARRVRLEELVAKTIDRISGSLTEELDMTIEKSSFACASTVNRFVTRFYFDNMPEAQRPLAPTAAGITVPIFADRKEANYAQEITLVPSHQQYDALAQWMYAFHRLVEENAKSVDGMDLNIEQNSKLGAILAAVPSIRGISP